MFLKENKQKIEAYFKQRCEYFPEIFQEIQAQLKACSPRVELAIKYLYITMPYSDIGNYPLEIFLDYAAHGVALWEYDDAVRNLPEDIFLNYVLYHRVNEEEIDICRSVFYKELKDWICDLSMEEAVLEVNYWCAKVATYQSTDDRTVSARTVYNCGYGRCGEESTFCVQAFRSVGIPARQVYAPRWSHCDDNHAWVEVWIAGTWYYMGACEPEPILNKGWFTNASSRAMMIHSRWFGYQAPREDIIGSEGMVTMLNQLPRYAITKEVQIQVIDRDQRPLVGADVRFEVLNYAAFATIATVKTDTDGYAYLTTGMGSLHVSTYVDGIYVSKLINTKEGQFYQLVIEEQEVQDVWISMDFIAPKDNPKQGMTTSKEIQKAHDKRIETMIRKRTYRTNEVLANEQRIFIIHDQEKELRLRMLGTLTMKDQYDFKADVLEEHLQYALQYQAATSENIFMEYILNPRVHNEVLTKYRSDISHYFSVEEQHAFQERPSSIWDYITSHIRTEDAKERESLITTPVACLKLKVASFLSKKVLFVAIARTFGIPARIHEQNQALEYMVDHKFYAVIDGAKGSGRLLLTTGKVEVPWTYFQNWSIAKLEAGFYRPLQLSHQKWTDGRLELELEIGTYRIVTSNRLPNGNTFAKVLNFQMQEHGKKELILNLRDANLEEMLENITIPQFYLRGDDNKTVAVDNWLQKDKTLLCFLEESKEPTEHILNEILERKEEFKNYKEQIIFIVRTPQALQDKTLAKCLLLLPNIQICYGNFERIIEPLSRSMYVDPSKLPLILIMNQKRVGIYATSGYNVGTGDMILRIMGYHVINKRNKGKLTISNNMR